MTDLALDGYLALCYAIVGRLDKNGKRIAVETNDALRKFGLNEGISNRVYLYGTPRYGEYVNRDILVTNIITGEVKEYKGTRAVSADIGIIARYISTYVKNKSIYRKTYKFEFKED